MFNAFNDRKLASQIHLADKEQLKQIASTIVDLFFKYLNKDIIEYDCNFDLFGKDGVQNNCELLNLIEHEIFGKAIYKSAPKYLKFIDNGVSSVNLIAATINSLLNQNLTAHLTDAPRATINEISLLNYIRQKIGFDFVERPGGILDIGGYFASGGMMGNMAAILVARNNLLPNVQKTGVREDVKLIVPFFASHYSTWHAMGWLGLGEDNVVHVKTNNFKYDIVELEKIVQELRNSNKKILAVVASLGDPYSMSIDDIPSIRKICDKYEVWLHGDGANGGILIFSKEFRDRLGEVHLCDSISLDTHKALGLNYPGGIFVCKEISKFNKIISHWNIINKPDSLDLGATTPFLNSRGFDSLKLWLLLKLYGEDGLAAIVDNKLKTVYDIFLKLRQEKRILLWNKPETFSILFQIMPQDFNINNFSLEVLSKYQVSFKQDLEQATGIKIHSFILPANLHFKTDIKGDVEVLSIQCAHEKIEPEIINNLIAFIQKHN
jgi:L-2,4-diaminobutyrate decarboxylase